ncbi:MAG: response regulator transcription factor, partial [Gammaproteobacteria bacterium]
DTSALAAKEMKPGLNAGPSARPESPLVERRERERRKSKRRAQAVSDLLETPSPGDAKAESNQVCTADMLTKREEQIVRLLGQGLTNKQMARQLGIMEDTVKKHLQNVFGKLGVRRRTLVVLRRLAGQPDSA